MPMTASAPIFNMTPIIFEPEIMPLRILKICRLSDTYLYKNKILETSEITISSNGKCP